MKIEIGKVYKIRKNVKGKATPGGSFQVEAVTGDQVKFKVLDAHGASAGGLFTIAAADFGKLVEADD